MIKSIAATVFVLGFIAMISYTGYVFGFRAGVMYGDTQADFAYAPQSYQE